MGAKKKEEPSAKNKVKEQNKVIQDKTFGLKNKNKSKVVQNYVKSVQDQVKHGQEKGGAKAREAAGFEAKKKKNNDAAAAALLASLFAGAQGLKGKKGEIIENTKKIDFYRDPREGGEDMPEDTIITCKFFLDGVENETYGWRWECPNRGLKCQYRHCLPQGYVIIPKKEREAHRKAAEAAELELNKKTIEEQIEEERLALSSEGLTPVTKETFQAWKERRKAKKQAELEEKMKRDEMEKALGKKGKGGGGKGKSILNGRALFSYNPDLFKDDDAGAEAELAKISGVKDEEQKENDDGQIKEKTQIDESLFQGEDAGADEDVDFD